MLVKPVSDQLKRGIYSNLYSHDFTDTVHFYFLILEKIRKKT